MKNIGIITQARMGSTRLPGKILKKAAGRPLLQIHVSRLLESNIPVFVATTTRPEDDLICDFCKDHSLPFIRGSEADVLSRFYDCAEHFNLEAIVRVTSDCPLIDGNLIADSWKKHQKEFSANTYISNVLRRSYPRGFDFEIFSMEALTKMQKEAQLPEEREHVTPYIWKNHPGDFKFIDIVNSSNDSDLRITVDEDDDFKLMLALIEKHQADKKNYKDIISLLRAHPELVAINKHVEQKKI